VRDAGHGAVCSRPPAAPVWLVVVLPVAAAHGAGCRLVRPLSAEVGEQQQRGKPLLAAVPVVLCALLSFRARSVFSALAAAVVSHPRESSVCLFFCAVCGA
jgi:hypothetical protein